MDSEEVLDDPWPDSQFNGPSWHLLGGAPYTGSVSDDSKTKSARSTRK